MSLNDKFIYLAILLNLNNFIKLINKYNETIKDNKVKECLYNHAFTFILFF